VSVFEFPATALTAEQWQQVNALAQSLRPGQALWLSGYFAGLDRGVRGVIADADYIPAPQGATAAGTPDAGGAVQGLTILYGSETGNSATLARILADRVRECGLQPVVSDMADYKTRKLKDEQTLIVITSTHGEGDAPQSAMAFFEFLASRKAPKLAGMKYAVLALGDSTYERYCEAGKQIDKRLAELGATQIEARVDCDVDYDEPAAAWIAAMVEKITPAASSGASVVGSARVSIETSAAPAAAVFDKRRPFSATVIDNFVLTGRGSSKETRHIELSLEESGLTFEPGDALGVIPHNDPALVEALLGALSLNADAPITLKDRATTLGAALATDFEITLATPRLIDHWAKLSGSAELERLKGEGEAEARTAFLRGHHVVDVVRRFPVCGLDAQNVIAGLRPLQPRLYSIASSQAVAADEVHLTISTVRYDLNGEPRSGVASGYFADRAEPDTTVPVYVQANPHFRMADDDTPIIMIGAGTGVAPYRAFLQERETRGASGKSWLFFGERNFRSDFLYQTEWQGFLKDGVLSRMNVAFSRDSASKTYVQHKLREQARDVYAWLEEGAHIYVCGDAANLAPDVHATLSALIQQESGRGRAAADEYLGTLQREHRYQLDVY
jgi:sulfite reductase (NADPH) flavoprotein alpha-component